MATLLARLRRGWGTGATAGVEGLYLPWEGDTLLSAVLSKALLLSNDRAIKDRSIMRQIQGST